MTDIQSVQDPKLATAVATSASIPEADRRLFDDSDLMEELRRLDPEQWRERVRAMKKRKREALKARTSAALDAAGLSPARELQS